MVIRNAFFAILGTSLLAAPACAQSVMKGANINFQYRLQISPSEDMSKARADILAEAEKDCEAAEKAFGLRCDIGNIQFNNNGNQFNNFGMMNGNFGNQPAPTALGANVNMFLSPKSQN